MTAGVAMNLGETLDVLAAVRADEIVIPTMGTVAPWRQRSSHPRDFVYLPSSMGQATSLALGLSLARPDRRVWVYCGDGSLLMNLGTLVTIAAAKPSNLTVFLFDNGVYEVTGGQPHVGAGLVDYAQVARGCGWERVRAPADPSQLGAQLQQDAQDGVGPVFHWLKVAPEPDAPGAASPGPTDERLRAFAAALA